MERLIYAFHLEFAEKKSHLSSLRNSSVKNHLLVFSLHLCVNPSVNCDKFILRPSMTSYRADKVN